MSIGLVSNIDYDVDGNIIDSYKPNAVMLENIVPESYGETAYKAICKGGDTMNKSVKRKKKR
jgi:hypothetical protein